MSLREKLLQVLQGVTASNVVDRFQEGSKVLAVVVRSDGDVQVELHLDGLRGSPFEQLFVVPKGAEGSVAQEVADFVDRFLDEKLVLAVDGHLLRGGRLWVPPERLHVIEHLSLSASWKGTFDGPARVAARDNGPNGRA